MSPPSGEKGGGNKRKRESDEDDQSKKKIITASDAEHNISRPASGHGVSKNIRSVRDQVPSILTSGGQKRKFQEFETKASKKLKRDDNGAAAPVSTITTRGLAQFNFHKELGRGGFGSVYLASVKEKNSTVAIKVLTKTKVGPIQLEKRVLRRLAGNPYICRLFSTFQTPSFAFLVMELLPGGDLENILEAEGPLDVKTTTLCTAQIICGLQHMHKLGVIHRDIKTSNIAIDHQGNIRICDFGLAVERIFGSKIIMGGAGTTYYKAPEMLSRGPYGSSADWWSFGVLLFHLLTNTYPYYGCKTDRQLRQMVLRNEPTYPDTLSPEAKDILPKLLCREQRRRLGYCGNIRQHPFYASIDWERVETKNMDPPFPPRMDTSPPASLLSDLPFYQDQDRDRCQTKAKTIRNFSFEAPDCPL